MTTQTPAMTIGQLAALAEVHVETIRYYERRGLIKQPERPRGSVRRYGSQHLSRLQLIRRAQTVGFSLDEIAELLAISGRRGCQEARLLTERRLAKVREQIDELRQLEVELKGMLTDCSGAASLEECPMLDRLTH